MLAVEFLVAFLFILILGYIVPAGRYYYWYHLRHDPANDALRIQHRTATTKQIWREIQLSVVTVVVFAMVATILWQFYKAGRTSIYWPITERPLWYFPVSIFLCAIVHDTYFYWSHRFMHWRPVFPYFHLAHHRSVTPTPWAIFAFQPLEAVVQALGVALLVLFLPLHPLALLLFLWYDTEVNTAGHTGYEVVPRAVSQHWLYRGFNTVRHHDSHHTNTRVNFGSFFNVWDRWMGTFQEDECSIVKRHAAEPLRISPASGLVAQK